MCDTAAEWFECCAVVTALQRTVGEFNPCSGFNTDYKSSELLKIIFMLCYVMFMFMLCLCYVYVILMLCLYYVYVYVYVYVMLCCILLYFIQLFI